MGLRDSYYGSQEDYVRAMTGYTAKEPNSEKYIWLFFGILLPIWCGLCLIMDDSLDSMSTFGVIFVFGIFVGTPFGTVFFLKKLAASDSIEYDKFQRVLKYINTMPPKGEFRMIDYLFADVIMERMISEARMDEIGKLRRDCFLIVGYVPKLSMIKVVQYAEAVRDVFTDGRGDKVLGEYIEECKVAAKEELLEKEKAERTAAEERACEERKAQRGDQQKTDGQKERSMLMQKIRELYNIQDDGRSMDEDFLKDAEKKYRESMNLGNVVPLYSYNDGYVDDNFLYFLGGYFMSWMAQEHSEMGNQVESSNEETSSDDEIVWTIELGLGLTDNSDDDYDFDDDNQSDGFDDNDGSCDFDFDDDDDDYADSDAVDEFEYDFDRDNFEYDRGVFDYDSDAHEDFGDVFGGDDD